MVAGKKLSDHDSKQGDILQAVLVPFSITSDNHFLAPEDASSEPLLPLLNLPVLSYVLEWVISSEVQSTFIYVHSGGKTVHEFIKSYFPKHDIQVIVTVERLTLGGVMRDLENKSLIEGDFLLASYDTICSIPLNSVVDVHRKRYKNFRNTSKKDEGSPLEPIMTIIFKPISSKTRLFLAGNSSNIIFTPTNNRILTVLESNSFTIPQEMLEIADRLIVRSDILNTGICICSPHVPFIFLDNFDIDTLPAFLSSVFENEEFLRKSIHCHFLENGIASPAFSSMPQYDAVSQMMLSRWFYPLTPDMKVLNSGKVSLSRNNIYTSEQVTSGQGTVFSENVLIGRSSSLGNHCKISCSSIGANCKIGSNVKLERCYIWNHVEIGDNVTMIGCIVANNVTIFPGTIIEEKCFIGSDTKIGPSTCIPKESIVCLSNSNTFCELANIDLGLKHVGNCYRLLHNVHCDYKSWLEDAVSETDLFYNEDKSSDEESDFTPPPDDEKLFRSELQESILRAIEEHVSAANLILEVNASKFAYNASLSETITAVVDIMLDAPCLFEKCPVENKVWITSFEKNISQLKNLWVNYLRNDPQYQLDALTTIEEYFCKKSSYMSCAPKLFHILYDIDVIEENTFLSWFENINSEIEADELERNQLISKIEPFINWLKEADETSSEED